MCYNELAHPPQIHRNVVGVLQGIRDIRMSNLANFSPLSGWQWSRSGDKCARARLPVNLPETTTLR